MCLQTVSLGTYLNRNNRVLSILQRLLKGHYAKAIEVTVLEELKAWLLSVTEPLKGVAEDMIKLTDELVCFSLRQPGIFIEVSQMASARQLDETPSSPSVSGPRRASRASEVTPRGLALALFILEGERYNAITPTDCISS